VVGRDGISDDEANAWEAEQWELAQRSEFFFAGIQFCFTATRPDWQPADSASQYSSFGGKPTAWRGSRPSSFSASSAFGAMRLRG
jgi:hypothetical protein